MMNNYANKFSMKLDMVNVADFIAQTLAKHGVTDVFGIPGGVILDLLYAFNRCDGICPHLNYHEQSAGFAACGYAQASGKLGVAYATRGPGFTNLITPMAEAYYESLPVMFLTAHSAAFQENIRCLYDQEIDTCAIAKSITKFAARIDTIEEFSESFANAIDIALAGKPGPVFLDISKELFSKLVDDNCYSQLADSKCYLDDDRLVKQFANRINAAKRPVILVGNGIDYRHAHVLLKLSERIGIPFISSRTSHSLLSKSSKYYGYIGSHGNRAANFILSKTDLVIAFGNRLNFPLQSKSFQSIAKTTEFIRYEIDESECNRCIPHCQNVIIDVNMFIEQLYRKQIHFDQFSAWINICNTLKEQLLYFDNNNNIEKMCNLLKTIPDDAIIVSDVGNCEFMLSYAAVICNDGHQILYSKSFGSLGSSICKSIGVYYSTNKPIVCIVGDQGIMFNIQEIQYIAQHKLPITIIIIDNKSSAMIKDIEHRRYGYYVHVDSKTGFSTPKWEQIFYAFRHLKFNIINMSSENELFPFLPNGNSIQNLCPKLPNDMYSALNNL